MADTLTLTLDTGDVTIKLRPDLAPGHVERITTLANEGFYDGVVFHRVDLLIEGDDLLIEHADVPAQRMQLGRDDVLEGLLDLVVDAHRHH